MKIETIHGANLEEINSKRFNIYFGISLGYKWFTEEHIKEYLLWALKNTGEKVAILIADKIHALNYEARNKLTKEKALEKAIQEGDKIEQLIRKIILELPLQENKKIIEIIRWEELDKDINYRKFVSFLYEEFRENPNFKQEINAIVNEYISKEKRKFSKEAIKKMGEYILEELPELLTGFTYNGTYYGATLYPHISNTKFFDLIFKIQNKEIFPKIYNMMKNQKNIFIELR